MFEEEIGTLEYMEGYKKGAMYGIQVTLRCLRECLPKALKNMENDILMQIAPEADIKQ